MATQTNSNTRTNRSLPNLLLLKLTELGLKSEHECSFAHSQIGQASTFHGRLLPSLMHTARRDLCDRFASVDIRIGLQFIMHRALGSQTPNKLQTPMAAANSSSLLRPLEKQPRHQNTLHHAPCSTSGRGHSYSALEGTGWSARYLSKSCLARLGQPSTCSLPIEGCPALSVFSAEIFCSRRSLLADMRPV